MGLDTLKGMDKHRMIFNIDRRTVTEGDVVELTWQCDGAESVTLTIDNGYRFGCFGDAMLILQD